MNLEFDGLIAGPETVVDPTLPQTLTGAWVDLGNELQISGAGSVGLWVNLDINDSENVRIRLLAKLASGGDEYSIPIKTVSTSDVKVEAEYIEFNSDSDQKMLLAWELDSIVPRIQFQVMAGTVGVSAGQIVSAYITTGRD